LSSTLDWLLDSDPAIRWQALSDLMDASPDVVAAERARVTREGWGARLLSMQGEDGQWEGGALFPGGREYFATQAATDNGDQPWTATEPTLTLLMLFGVDPAEAAVHRAVERVAASSKWEHDLEPFFEGETEPCINGKLVSLGAYYGQNVDPVVERLLGEQLADGGWNCEAENGSIRSSFDTTINVLEGLLAHERAGHGSAESIAARRRGEEFLLERRMFRRKSNGEVVRPEYLQLSFPNYWHYDVLRGLDHFRAAGNPPDARAAEAIELVRSKRQADGRWLLENTHPGRTHFDLEEGVGRPSRWMTLRALRVLDWAVDSREPARHPGASDVGSREPAT